jgi:hypothetical protein
VRVTPEPTPSTMTGSRRRVEAPGLLIRSSLYKEQGGLGIAPMTVGNGKRPSILPTANSRMVGDREPIRICGAEFVLWRPRAPFPRSPSAPTRTSSLHLHERHRPGPPRCDIASPPDAP